MTSLSEQLKRLAVPTTVATLGAKSRPSLLFTPRYASTLDHEHFYEIGVSGLAALNQLNPQFASVGASLFDPAAPTMERSVQTASVNQRIDEEVRDVLLMLQPYLLLQPALKILEWLVHRFHIEIYSKDELLMLALPYHETPTFVKILQAVDITDPSSRWNWLLPIQKPGHPLGRQDLLRHCAGDPGLLKMVCTTTLAAVKCHGPQNARRLSTLAAFHTAVIVGTLEVKGGITELQMSYITKSLLRGLKSQCEDFAAGSMMAIAQISRKAQLGADFVATLVRVLVHKSLATLASERVTLLVLLYAEQREAPPEAALPLVLNTALANALTALSERGIDVFPLALPMLDAALSCKDKEGAKTANAVVKLVTGLTLSTGQAEALADRVVSACTPAMAQSKRYCQLLSDLERLQGAALDAAVDRAAKRGGDDSIKTALGRHGSSAFLRLYHASAQQRAQALQELAASVDQLGTKDSVALGEALVERLRDDSAEVVLAALAFPSAALKRLMGANGATEAVLSVLTRCAGAGSELVEVARAAVVALAKLNFTDRPARTLAHLLPHLMPTDEEQTEVALAILRSPLAMRDAFLSRVAAVKDLKSAEDVCTAVAGALRGWHQLPPPEQFQELLSECQTVPLALASTLLLAASLPQQLPPAKADALARDVLATVARFKSKPSKKRSAVRGVETNGSLETDLPGLAGYAQVAAQGVFPLPALLSALADILRAVPPLKTDNPFWLLQVDNDVASLELRCLSVLVQGASSKRSTARQALYAKALAEFLRLRYPAMGQRIELLVQAACSTHEVVTPFLQVRFLRLASALLVRADGQAPTSTWFAALPLCVGASAVAPVRVATLACANDAVNAGAEGSALLRRIVEHAKEIALDAAQLPTAVLHAFSNDKTEMTPNKSLAANRAALIATTAHAYTPPAVAAALLLALSRVPAPTVLAELAPLVHRMLDSGAVPSTAHRRVLCAVLERYTPLLAPALKNEACAAWVLLARCLRHLKLAGDGKTVAETAMLSLSKQTLAAMDQDTTERLLSVLVEVVSECDRSGIAAAASRAVKHMSLPATLPAKHLTAMATATGPLPEAARRKTRFVETAPSPDVVSSAEWRRGVAVLELVQNKTLKDPAQFLPALFAVLARCLQFEQQAPVEYPKQLVLSLVLQCCQRAGPGEHPGLNVEAVVQCVRASQNPQTHHHALLVLAQLAAIAPRQVLHNVMSVFTFMGSSVLRQDDAYSVQVITKIVDTVVPTIVEASNSAVYGDRPAGASGRGVLRVFVDALPGIPAHRVQPLFQRLLAALGPREALWPLMALLLEAQVMRASGQSATGLSLAEELPALESVVAATRIVDYLLVLPTDKLPTKKNKSVATLDTNELFDVPTHTEKQLRHFKFLLAQQVGALLAASDLPRRILEVPSKPGELEALYSDLLERLLTLVQRWLTQVNASQGSPTGKYWRVMLTLALDTLDKVNGLLPPHMFLIVIKGLLTHRLPVLRRKAMELLNARLQSQKDFDPVEVLKLLPKITKIVATILKPDSDAVAGPCAETELCQQTALLSVKLLAHRLAAEHPDPFVHALPLVIELVCAELPHGNLQAAVVLCLAELCVVLRVRAVAHVPRILPAIVRLLDEQAKRESPDLATLSVVTAADKISESLASFLGGHLPSLLRAGAIAAARWSGQAGQPRVAPTLARLAAARQRLAAAVAPRVLVPAVARCHQMLMEQREFAAIPPLCDVLSTSFSELQGPDLRQLLPALSDLFLSALELRGYGAEPAALESETHVIAALVRLALKLSEEAFKPMFYALFHWASTIGAPVHRAVTFYRLSAELARSLKGLFALFATASVAHAASLLSTKAKPKGNTDELREYVLESLLLAISHGGARFVNMERFNALMQPIVNQLELAVTVKGADRARRLVAPCLAHLALASENESLWKQLNYQVLLKTRDSHPEVRLAALTALCQVAGKLAADYLPLLPEAIPFLAELLEDEDEGVERAAQDAMREMQDTLGEPLDKYL